MVMPSLIASDLWRQTGRLADAGPELFTVTDRKDTLFVLGPTHEEEVTNVVASAVKSYRQLPLRLYQTGGYHHHWPIILNALCGGIKRTQVSRRGTSPVRPDARPRVHHEGLVHV